MRTARVFCGAIGQDNAVISDIQLRHLTKVLRLKTGDIVQLFDGKGTVAQAVIEKITKDEALLKVQNRKIFDTAGRRKIVIAPSIAKGQRFEMLVAKCTELGIDGIAPVIFERTVKQQLQHHRLESIAVESAKQCGRIFLPAIDRPADFQKALENLRAQYPKAKIVFGSLAAGAESIINLDLGTNDCLAFVGPEGGLAETEENLLKKINAQSVRLTDTILRIETAAIAFAAVLAAKRDLGK